MARAKFPLLSEAATGSIGGIEFKANQYGHLVGRRSISPNRSTPAQLTHRAKFARAIRWWQSLSEADQVQWQAVFPGSIDLRSDVIACYLRFPDGWEANFGFAASSLDPLIWSSIFVMWYEPPFNDLYIAYNIFSVTTAGVKLYYHVLDYPGDYVHPKQMKLGGTFDTLGQELNLPLPESARHVLINLQAFGNPNGQDLGRWTLSLSRPLDGATIFWPHQS